MLSQCSERAEQDWAKAAGRISRSPNRDPAVPSLRRFAVEGHLGDDIQVSGGDDAGHARGLRCAWMGLSDGQTSGLAGCSTYVVYFIAM